MQSVRAACVCGGRTSAGRARRKCDVCVHSIGGGEGRGPRARGRPPRLPPAPIRGAPRRRSRRTWQAAGRQQAARGRASAARGLTAPLQPARPRPAPRRRPPRRQRRRPQIRQSCCCWRGAHYSPCPHPAAADRAAASPLNSCAAALSRRDAPAVIRPPRQTPPCAPPRQAPAPPSAARIRPIACTGGGLPAACARSLHPRACPAALPRDRLC